MLNNFFKQSNFDRYVAYLKSTSLSDATLKRKLSSLTSFQNFLIKKKLIDPPQLLALPTHSVIKSKLSLTKFISSIRQKVTLPKSFVTYLIISSLLIIAAGTGYTLYRQAITKAKLNLAYTTAGTPVYGNRFLSFQGRLTDSSGNPISSPTTIGMVFELYNTPNLGEGTTLYTSAIGNSQVVSPDDNGIFSVTIGKSHGTTIPDSVFTQNSSVYLQITAGGEIMDPRQPIATVGYAINSESLQGLPPSASGLKDTVLVIDSNGDLNLGETSPTIRSTSGTLGIEGQAILIKATNGLDTSNIKIDPVNSNGAIQFNTVGDGSSNAIVATNSNLSTGNLFFGQIGNDNRGYNFIDFQNFNVGTSTYASRFSVTAGGNVNVGATLFTSNISIGNTFLTANAANLNLLTGLTPSSGSIIYSTSTNLATSSVGNSGQILVSNGTAPPTWIDSSSIGQIYTAGNGLTLSGTTFQLGGVLTQNTNIGTSSFGLTFSTPSGITALHVGNSGAIGIGTTNPFAPLHIERSWAGTDLVGMLINNAGTGANTAGSINFGLSGALTGKIQNIIDLSGATTSLAFSNFYSGALRETMRLYNGNVGIGTSSPLYKLDINGDARISNQLYVGTGFTGAPGQVLTSNGVGLSWTTPSGTTYTATNGLNLFGSAFGLGGTLTQDTNISLSSFSLSFQGLGGTQSLFLASNGYVGIGTTNPTAALEIGGVAGEIVTSSGDLTLSAGSSNVSFNNNNLININQLFASGGIGVTGDSYFTNDITADSGNFHDNVNIYFQNQTNYSDGLRVYKRGNVSDIDGNILSSGEIGYHSFYGWNGSAYQRGAYVLTKASEDWSGSANGTEYYIYTSSTGTTLPAKRFTVNSSGNIAITGNLGIGITNTNSSLEISKNGGSDIMLVNNNVTTTAGDLLGEIKFRTDDDSTSGNLVKAYIKAVAETTFTGGNHRAMLNFGTGLGTSAATTQMTLSSDGYLGLGTTAPSQRLDITGSMKLSGQMYVGTGFTGAPGQVLTSNGVGLSWTTPSGTTYTATNGLTLNGTVFGLGGTLTQNTNIGTSSFSLSFQGLGGTQSLYLASSGYVGIGNTNPQALFHVGSSTSRSSLWIAGGAGGNPLAYSYNGINWTSIGTTLVSSVNGVAWNGTRWVAMGSGNNSIIYSDDGLNWVGLGTSIFDMGYNVAWNGTRWVAVGTGDNSIAYSSDGITWTGIGTSIFSDLGVAVAWNGTRFVAVGMGSSNTIAYSSDGINWTGAGNSIFDVGAGIAWNGTRWVAGGQGSVNTLAYSSDGISWTGIGTSIFDELSASIAWNGTRFVAMGNGSSNTIAYSSDGISWAGIGTSIFNVTGWGIAWNGTLFVATGASDNGSLAYSSDSINWNMSPNTELFSTQGSGIASAPAPQLIPAQPGVPLQTSALFDSNVGIGVTNPLYKLDVGGDIKLTGGLFVGTGNAGTLGQVLTSTGVGLSWTDLTSNSLSLEAQRARRDIYDPVTSWVNTGSTLPTDVGGAQSAIIGNYVYLFGGYNNNSGSWSNKILKAPLSNPTAWVDTGSTLPNSFSDSQLSIIRDNIYLFGGYNNSYLNTIYSAPLSNPTAWVDTGSTLPGVLSRSSSAVIGDYVYLFGGTIDFSVGTNNIYRAPLSNPTAWVNTGSTLPANTENASSAVIGNYIYLFGGASSISSYKNIFRAPLSNPTAWVNTGSLLLSATGGAESVTIGDYIYLLAGTFGNEIYRAPLTNPTLWVDTGSTIPNSSWLSDSHVSVIGDYVYLFGGSSFNTYNTIYRAGIKGASEESNTAKYAPNADKLYNQTLYTSIFSDGMGNIGLGTTDPSQKLDVAGSIKLSGQLYVGTGFTGAPGQYLVSTGIGLSWADASGSGSATNGLSLISDSIGLGGILTQNTNIGTSSFSISFQGLGGTQSLFLASSGFVGIGITNPQALLHVGSSTSRSPLWIAGGQGSEPLAYSTDGINWTGIQTSIFQAAIGVAWNGSRWVAVGMGDNNSIAYSDDGINWVGVGNSMFPLGYGVAWNGTRWVAVGGDYSGNTPNTIAYSSDGISWTGVGTSIFSQFGVNVAWNGTRFVAVGAGSSNTIAYSSDGISWTGVGTSIFDGIGAGVAWNGTRWVAGGQGSVNTLAYSSDGISWTGVGTSIFDSMGIGIAWNGTRFVAVGSGELNTMAYSSDGINWTGNGYSVFDDSGWGVAWNGSLFVATGDGTNGSLAYSSDGINWNMSPNTGLFAMQGMGIASAPAPQLIPAQPGVPISASAIFDSNVSIGTTANNYKLNIDGDVNITGDYLVNGTAFANFWTASGDNIYNNNLGNVGIGNTDPQYKLDIEVGQDDIQIAGNGVNGTGIFFTNRDVTTQQWYMAVNGDNTSRGTPKSFFIQNRDTFETNFLIDPTGNVGIGVETPSKRLDVGGDIKLTGQLYVGTGFTGAPGQVLVSTGVGLSWETISSSSSSNLPFSTFYGFDSYVNSLGGFGTGGVQRITKTGDLVNIGTIQANRLNIGSGGTFGTGVTYPAFASTKSPYAMTLNDFNGDNKPDVAIINNHGGGDNDSITVKFNNGDGTFDVGTTYSITGNYSVSITSADFDQDGKIDLAVASGNTSNVLIFFNNGDGTFASGVSYPNPFNVDNNEIVAADINQDSKIDIVGSNFHGGINTYKNLGGTFDTGVTSPNPYGGSGYVYRSALTINDFNNDGYPDAAASIGESSVIVIYPNDKNGNFEAGTSFPSPTTNIYDITSGDFNSDSKADIATVTVGTGRMVVHLNNGDGTFSAGTTYPCSYYPYAVKTADINGDGKLDIVTANHSSDIIQVFFNNGDGTFSSSPTSYSNMATEPNDLATADLDGNGTIDIVTSSRNYPNPVITVFKNSYTPILFTSASGSVGIGTTNPLSKLSVVGSISGDNLVLAGNNQLSGFYGFSNYLNSSGGLGTGGIQRLTLDGNLTNISSIQAGQLNITGGGNFGVGATYSIPNTQPYNIVSTDLNGDGKSEIITSNMNNNNISIYINNGDNTFSAGNTYPTISTTPYSITAGDFNGDGKNDLATANGGDHKITVFINTGNATFGTGMTYPTIGAGPHTIIAGDFNVDGKDDLATVNYLSHNMTVFINTGNGTFGRGATYPTIGTSPRGLATGDLNGDGIPDLISSNGSGNNITVFTNNGNGTFGTGVTYPTIGNAPYSIIVKDLNGDGKNDLATGNVSGNNITVFTNTGNGTFGTGATYPTISAGPTRIVSADFNGDGKNDLATSNQSSTKITVFANNGNGTFGTGVTYPTIGTFPTHLTSADFNGDGKPDIATANSSASNITVFTNISTPALFTSSSGYVGIGTTNPRTNLELVGDATGFMTTSSERARRDIYDPVTSWVDTGSTLPASMYDPQTAIIGNYIYLFSRPISGSRNIYKAPLSNPTAWISLESTLPATDVNDSQLAIIDNYVYLFGAGSYDRDIYKAPLSNPTAWINTGSTIPSSGVSNSQLITVGNYVYMLGGMTTNTIHRAPLSNPTSWSNTGSTLPDIIDSPSSAIIANYVYLFGGHNNSSGITSKKIYRAPLSNPTTWVDTGSTLPSQLTESQSIVIGDYVYLLGGSTGGSSIKNIYRAPLSNPTAWVDTGSTLPGALTKSAPNIIGDYVYLIGGYNSNVIYRAGIKGASEESNTAKYAPNADKLYNQTLYTSISSDGMGNIGLGTTTPRVDLTVVSPTTVGDDLLPSLGNIGGKFALLNGGGSGLYGMLTGVLGTGSAFTQVQRTDGGATAYNYFLQPNGGNVSIGGTTASQLLTLNGTAGGSAGMYINSAIPSSTSYTLYNNAGTLTWNGVALATGGGSISGTTNYIPKYTSASTLGNSIISEPSGYINVAGLAIIGNAAGNNYNENLRLPEASSGWSSIAIGATAGTSGTGPGQWTIVRYPSANNYLFGVRYMNTDALNIAPSGYVGIGTTGPLAKLEVRSSGYDVLKLMNPNSGGSSWMFGIWDSGLGGPTNTLSIGYSGAAGGGVGGGSTYNLMNLDATGYVGIAGSLKLSGQLYVGTGFTGAPGQVLVSTGVGLSWASASGSSTSTTNGLSLISSAVGLGGTLTQNTNIGTSSFSLSFQGLGGTPSLSLAPSGYVGIGVTNSNYPLHVVSTSSVVFTNNSTGAWPSTLTLFTPNMPASYTSASFSFGVSDTARNRGYIGFKNVGTGSTANLITFGFHSADYLLNIQADGNVGISTASPIAPLDVGITKSATVSSTVISDLSVNLIGSIASPTFYDSNNPQYYVNPASIGENSNSLSLTEGGSIKFNVASAGTTSVYISADTASRIQSFNNGLALGTGDSNSIGIGNTVVWNNQLFLNSNSNIGFGTTAPTQKLTVSSNSDVYMRVEKPIYPDYFDFGISGHSGIINMGAGDTTNSDIYFRTNGSNRLTITDTGFVGVGTIGPSYKFQVSDNTNFFQNLGHFENLSTGNSAVAAITIGSTGGGIQIGKIASTASSSVWNGYGQPNDGFIYLNATSNDLNLIAANTGSQINFSAGHPLSTANADMVIKSNSIGIGTTNPTQKLDIVGIGNSGVRLKQGGQVNPASLSTSYYNGLTFENDSTTNSYSMGYSTNGYFGLNYFNGTSTYSNLLTLTNTGNLGLGTTNPKALLQVGTEVGGTGPVFIVTSNGKVGIGVTNALVRPFQVKEFGYSIFMGGTGLSPGANIFADTSLNIGTTTGNSIAFYTNNIQRATINGSNGKVSINGGVLNFGTTATTSSIPTMSAGDMMFGTSNVVNANNSGRIWIYVGTTRYTFRSDSRTAADYSEYFHQSSPSEEGDLMVISSQPSPVSDTGQVEKSSQPNQTKILGVVSNAIRGTSYNDPEENRGFNPEFANVGLLGHIYTKVCTENGDILPGDRLTSSSIPGVAMRATQASEIVGYATESYSESDPTKVKKIMTYVSPQYFDPALEADSIANNQFNINYQIPESALASLGYLGTKNQLENAIYTLKNNAGQIVTKIGQFAQITTAKIKASLVSTTNLIAENIVGQKILTQEIVSPVGNIDHLTSLDIQTTSLTAQNIETEKLTAQEASVSTLYADNIISQEGSFGEIMSNKISSLRDEMKNIISARIATESAILAQSHDWLAEIATDSAKITGDLALSDNLVVGAKLMVNGDTQLASAFISGTFTAGEIAIKDNIIETANTALYIQPSKIGSVHIMGDTLVIADNGSIEINANVTVHGSLFANLLKADEIETNKLTSTEVISNQLKIATDSAQTIVASDTDINLATDSAKLTSNATAGTATLPTGKTELIISTNKLSSSSMVYLTPVGSTNNQVIYVKNKVTDSNPYFTIALDQPLDHDININWWIIN